LQVREVQALDRAQHSAEPVQIAPPISSASAAELVLVRAREPALVHSAQVADSPAHRHAPRAEATEW
jgi:hypothetical protein